MPVDTAAYQRIRNELGERIGLVAVSKTKPVEDILTLYSQGQRDFGENYVQELVDKQAKLPADIRWHFIGHLQSNKIKHILPFVYLIHGVDSGKLLAEIDKQAGRIHRVADVLLQVHIAREETKFGFDAAEVEQTMEAARELKTVRIKGLMGMASNTGEMAAVHAEFHGLKTLFDRFFPAGGILSMGMSGDYTIAVQEGSNLVRIGSLLFGARG